jgi:uncharacterized LabA/DUF88 family protein
MEDIVSKETVAVYWDFENIHASVFDTAHGSGAYSKPANRSKSQEAIVNINAIYDFAATFGNVVINKAYCNWRWFSNYQYTLLKCGVELIQLFPPGGSAKNGADIKLSLDAVEDILRFPHISSIVIIGGDSDFIPLAQKIKAAGKDLVGVGCRATTNQYWANHCSDFKYYEAFGAAIQQEVRESATTGVRDAVELITRAIAQISSRTGEKYVHKAAIRPMIKRLDPTFDEANYNCKTFSDLLGKYKDRFKIQQGEHDHMVCMV